MSKHIVIDARIRPASTGRYVDRLLEHLQQIDSKNRYTVLLQPGDTWRPHAPNFSAKICTFKRFSFNPLDQITYARYLTKLQPDLVHFGMTPQEPMFYRGKRITTTHDLTMFNYTRPGKLPLWLHKVRMVGYRLLFSWSLKQAKAILVPTHFVKEDITRKYPHAKGKVTVTYEASEPALSGKAAKPAGIDRPFILHVGSPFPHKNIERLVGAFERLKERHPDLKLVLAGKKEQYFTKLEASVKNTSPARDDIIFPGFVSDEELKWLYQNAETYVLPSVSEGFGLPGLEAMAHGCPVASSNTTCLPEVYGKAAHYFDPYNEESIAATVDDILTDTGLRKKLIQSGYAQLKKYSWRRMAEQTLAIYKQVLSDS